MSATSTSAIRKSWRRAENPLRSSRPGTAGATTATRARFSMLRQTISVPGVVRVIRGPEDALRQRLEWGDGRAPLVAGSATRRSA